MIYLASSTEGKLFSKIDFSDAYLQVEVDPGCKEFLTIETHRGLFQYNLLPFGIECAPTIFQQVMYTMLEDLPFAAAYLGDIIIASSNKEDHLSHLIGVVDKISKFGFRIRRDKCSFL